MITIHPINTFSCTNMQFVYAHGEAEKLLGTDLISYEKLPDDSMNVNQIHHCVVKNQPALLFLWSDVFAKRGFQHTGLVVLLSDFVGLEYAIHCFKTKELL